MAMIRQQPLMIRHSDREAGIYAVFTADGWLYRYDCKVGEWLRIAALPMIAEDGGSIRIDYHHPYVCVSQRYGLRCAVVHLQTGSVRNYSREDYHAAVSSYAVCFVEHGGRCLFIHQTHWNRLAVSDPQTGECLSVCADDGGHPDDYDYFHSLLQPSPDGKLILSNGWIWHPIGMIYGFTVEQLLEGRLPERFQADYESDADWDRPCAFVGSDQFVIATDDIPAFGDEDGEDSRCQLWYFKPDDSPGRSRRLRPHRKVRFDGFMKNAEGCAIGTLSFDRALNVLIAISGDECHLLSPDGDVLSHLAALPAAQTIPWQYNEVDQCLYKWNCGAVVTEDIGG